MTLVTTLSRDGRITIPRRVRTKLGLVSGAKIICQVEGDSIILKSQPLKLQSRKGIMDRVTGLLVTKRRANEAWVTSDMVKACLADFP